MNEMGISHGWIGALRDEHATCLWGARNILHAIGDGELFSLAERPIERRSPLPALLSPEYAAALLEFNTLSDELVMALLADTRERCIHHFEPRLCTASEAWLEYLRLDRARVLVPERTMLVNAKILAPARGTLFDNIRIRRARLLALFELSIECHTDITDRVQALLLHAVTGLTKPPMAEVTTFVSRPKPVSTPESSPVEPLRATHSERAGAVLRRSAS